MTDHTTGQIVPLHPHEDLQELLPWYVTGRLEPAEMAQIEAHLGKCAECQADVRFQRQLNSEIAALPVDVEHSWQAMRDRLRVDAARRSPTPLWRAWVGWAAACVVVVAGAGLALPVGRQAAYHALGAPPAPAAAGNLVVIFRPDAPEQELRDALRSAGARLVDGPTASDGYVLRVAPAGRSAALARLRARPSVVLAQPIGDGP